MYHLVPDYKEKQKSKPSKKWSYEKQNPVIHKKRITYKAKYMRTRRHIDELMKESYQRIAPQETMTLEELAHRIHDISGIFFKPSTLLSLSERYRASKGHPLLEKVSESGELQYKISKNYL